MGFAPISLRSPPCTHPDFSLSVNSTSRLLEGITDRYDRYRYDRWNPYAYPHPPVTLPFAKMGQFSSREGTPQTLSDAKMGLIRR